MIARILLACALASSVFGQNPGFPARKPMSDEMLTRVRPIMDGLYRLDYPPAEALCQRLIQDFPDHPAGYVYLERTYFSEELSKARLWSAARALGMDLFSDSPRFNLPAVPDSDARFRRAADWAIEKAHLWIKQHPDDLSGQYLLGSAYAFKSAYEFSIRHSRLSASADASRTFKVLSKLVHDQGDVVDARALTGAFSILADSLDFKTKVVAALFLGIQGNLKVGRRDMEDASERGFLENDDAKLLLSILYTRERDFDQAMTKLAQLHKRYPENYLVHLEMAGLDLMSGNPTQALKRYREMLAKDSPSLERSVVLSRMGVASRMTGDFAQSERWLRDAVASPGISPMSLSLARLELGKTLDLQARRVSAVEQYRLVLQGNDFLGIQREAQQWLRRPYDRAAMSQDNNAGGLVTLD
jgi:tetratricopeptide (TPR) repeat protein